MNEMNPIWNDIQARIEAAMAQNKLDTVVAPPIVFPGKPVDIVYDIELYKQLQQAATKKLPKVMLDVDLAEASWRNWPLIGNLLQKVRRSIHGIALVYANKAANQALEHQQTENWQLWEAMGRLMAITQQQQRTIDSLKAQLAEIKQVDA